MNESGDIVASFMGEDANGDGIFVKKLLANDAIQFLDGDGITTHSSKFVEPWTTLTQR